MYAGEHQLINYIGPAFLVNKEKVKYKTKTKKSYCCKNKKCKNYLKETQMTGIYDFCTMCGRKSENTEVEKKSEMFIFDVNKELSNKYFVITKDHYNGIAQYKTENCLNESQYIYIPYFEEFEESNYAFIVNETISKSCGNNKCNSEGDFTDPETNYCGDCGKKLKLDYEIYENSKIPKKLKKEIIKDYLKKDCFDSLNIINDVRFNGFIENYKKSKNYEEFCKVLKHLYGKENFELVLVNAKFHDNN